MEKRKKRAFLSFGPGTQFVSEDWLFDEMAGFGMSIRAFRQFLQALHVPQVQVGSTRLINLFQFRLAVAAISRLGQPDFFAPGSDEVRRCRAAAHGATSLDPAYFAECWEGVLAELMASRKAAGLPVQSTVDDFRQAAWKLVEAMELTKPSSVQSAYDSTLPPHQNATHDLHPSLQPSSQGHQAL
jgi:hypothetical protein